MELAEPLERINYWLEREFGRIFDDSPQWRVVLAGDCFEQRWMTHTDEGIELLNPEVRQVKKYQHIKPNRYVLERLVPVVGETDLVTQTSYEPAYTFEDRYGNYLPPRFDACKLIIENIYEGLNAKGFAKYKDPDTSPEMRSQMLQDMEEKLFGNETPVGDALTHGYGVTDFNEKVNFSEEKTR